MSYELSLDEIIKTQQWDTDIRHIINRHIKNLFERKWKLSDEITEWRNTMMKWIEEYVTQQKELVEQQYAKKVTILNTLRDLMLQQASKYEENKDTEQINQLVNQCENLKIELATLVPVMRSIPCLQLITDEQQQQQQTEEPVKEIVENSEQKIHDNPSPFEQITPPPTDSSNETPPINTNENSQPNASPPPPLLTLIEKCPICFMIFPQTMTAYYRNAHINEHYNDD